jgi:hypothetical protein
MNYFGGSKNLPVKSEWRTGSKEDEINDLEAVAGSDKELDPVEIDKYRRRLDIQDEPSGLESKKFELTPEQVKNARSLDELCQLLQKTDKIAGLPQEGEYTGDYVAQKVRDFEKYFQDNVDRLLLSVITDKKGDLNDELLNKMIYIPVGQDDLGLRQKVKDLMEVKWDERFHLDKDELMIQAVGQTTSLDELCGVINKFIFIKSGEITYQPTNIMSKLKTVSRAMNDVISSGNWQEVDVNKISREIYSAMSPDDIPEEYGIYSQAYKLIFNEMLATIKQRKLESSADRISQQGLFSGLGKRIAGFFGFGRQKK